MVYRHYSLSFLSLNLLILEMPSGFQAVLGGAAKLNTGFYIPLVGLGTYKITGEQVGESRLVRVCNRKRRTRALICR